MSLWLVAGSACGPADDLKLFALPTDNGKEDFLEVDPSECPGDWLSRQASPAAWTVMHFAAADNNLEDEILDDINEMEAGLTKDAPVNVIVFLDKHSTPGGWLYRLQPDQDPKVIRPDSLIARTDEEPNTGDPRLLTRFGRWAATCYPADRYMLIIGGHGSGWSSSLQNDPRTQAAHLEAREHGEALREIAPDDSSNRGLYVNELANAIRRISYATIRYGDPRYSTRLAAYGSDACLMQTIEVGTELSGLTASSTDEQRPNTTYILGSEETEPGPGWPYTMIIGELGRSPNKYANYPHQLFSRVAEMYRQSYPSEAVTFSVINTSELQTSTALIDRIALLLNELVEAGATMPPLPTPALTPAPTPLWSVLRALRQGCYSFGDGYADIGQYLSRLRQRLVDAGLLPGSDPRWKELGEQLGQLLDRTWADLVVSRQNTAAFAEASGLSIFFPLEGCSYYGLDVQTYAKSQFARETAWDELVIKLIEREQEQTGKSRRTGQLALGVDAQETTVHPAPEPTSPAPVSVSETRCELRAGKTLLIDSGPASCAPGDGTCATLPRVSLTVETIEQQLVVTKAFVRIATPLATPFEVTLGGSWPVTDVKIQPRLSYSGNVTIPLVDEARTRTVTLGVSFTCDKLVFQTGCR